MDGPYATGIMEVTSTRYGDPILLQVLGTDRYDVVFPFDSVSGRDIGTYFSPASL